MTLALKAGTGDLGGFGSDLSKRPLSLIPKCLEEDCSIQYGQNHVMDGSKNVKINNKISPWLGFESLACPTMLDDDRSPQKPLHVKKKAEPSNTRSSLRKALFRIEFPMQLPQKPLLQSSIRSRLAAPSALSTLPQKPLLQSSIRSLLAAPSALSTKAKMKMFEEEEEPVIEKKKVIFDSDELILIDRAVVDPMVKTDYLQTVNVLSKWDYDRHNHTSR